jgi:hypothetical protein
MKRFLLLATLVLPFRDLAAQAPRHVDVVERVQLTVSPGERRVRLWIPRLPNNFHQSVSLLNVQSPWPHQLTQDPDFGNHFFHMEGVALSTGTLQMNIVYRVVRREQAGPKGNSSPVSLVFKKPRGLMVITDEIREISNRVAGPLSAPMDKARALYDYVLKHMAYDKSGQGWGRGDSIYACRVGKGNCTDFHSLFISLALASGLPAKFQMGYLLPRESEGTIPPGYHCWAEFFVEGEGWVAVDISEASKHPDKADYFFGHLDADRVLVSTGRDIRPSEDFTDPPLNFVSKPHVEVDGKTVNDFEWQRTYKEATKP